MSDPIHVISLGAGVQSSAMLLMACEGIITPRPRVAIFADTQCEPASVYRWLEGLKTKSSIPIEIVTAGSLETDTLKLRQRRDGKGYYIHSGIPHYSVNADGSHGHGPRQCTHDFKITPLHRAQRVMVATELPDWKRRHRAACKAMSLWRAAVRVARRAKTLVPMRPNDAWDELQSDPLVVVWIGISTDEASRCKDSRVDWMRHRWPLIEQNISRKQCQQWLVNHGFGSAPKSACVFCPYHNDKEWLRLKTEEPDEFARAVAFDHEYRRLKVQTVSRKGFTPFIHSDRVPLDRVEFRVDRQLDLFTNECEGMCGL